MRPLRANRSAALFVLALLAPAGCGGASAPGAVETSGEGGVGSLVVRVAGHPRDIRYFINGKRFKPEAEIEWWRDARIEVELEAGTYEVEAEYLVRAFAGEGETYRIKSDGPVTVQPGRVTLLYARIDKDYRGVPKRKTEAFSVIHPSRSSEPGEPGEPGQPGEADSKPQSGQPEPGASGRGTRSHVHEDTEPPAEVIRIRAASVDFAPTSSVAPFTMTGNSIRIAGSDVQAGAAREPLARPDAGNTLSIQKSRVTQTNTPVPSSSAAATPSTTAMPTESVRIRKKQVEFGAVLDASLATPERGNAIRIRGTSVEHMDAGPPPPKPQGPPEAIQIRNQAVQRQVAPQFTPPSANAPTETIRIRGTRVEGHHAP